MIVLRINDVDIPAGWAHTETDWQVSTNEQFTDIIAESLNDSVNLTSKVFNYKTTIGQVYYGRARMLLNVGWTEWSNIEIFLARDINEVVMSMDIPSVIETPTVTSNYDLWAHPSSNFTITTSPFTTPGNATHEKTSYFIEDSNGNTVWSNLNDTVHLTSIRMTDLLPLNEVLHLHVAHTGSNGVVSGYGSLTFYTSDDNNFGMNRVFRNVRADRDIFVEIPFIADIDVLEWALYDQSGIEITNGIRNDLNLLITEDNFIPNVTYTLAVKGTVANVTREWSYYFFTTKPDAENPDGVINYVGIGEDIFPLRFPYRFRN